ncbi:MAG: ParB N-terminal domain-containing protein [Candidatus Paceibacterota bacterium]|jgi:ParB family chromosome partitioning protein
MNEQEGGSQALAVELIGACMEEVRRDLPEFSGKIRYPMLRYIGPRHRVDLANYLGSVVYVHPELLIRDEDQPRKHFDPSELAILAENMKIEGQQEIAIIYPLKASSGGQEIIGKLLDGERRWRSCRKGSLPFLALVATAIEDDSERLMAQLRANHLDEEHVVLDVFRAVVKLNLRGKKNVEIASNLGCSPSRVANFLSLKNLDPEVLKMLDAERPKKDRLTFLTAVQISRLRLHKQWGLANLVLQKRLSLEVVKREVNRLLSLEGTVDADQQPREPHIGEAFEQFKTNFRILASKTSLLREQPNAVLRRVLQRATAQDINGMQEVMSVAIREIEALSARIKEFTPKQP